MKLNRLILIMQLVFLFSCLSHFNGKAACTTDTLFIEFYIEGKLQNIDNHFNITIVHGTDSIKAKTVGNRLEAPDLPDRLDYTIIFTYKKYSLSFNKISKKMLLPDYNFTWEFGVDNRPFDKSFDILPPKKLEADKTSRQLQCLRINPMEEGVGLLFVNQIK